MIVDVVLLMLLCLYCRSSMAVIPQDPFLFAGSVRENLDPCSKVFMCMYIRDAILNRFCFSFQIWNYGLHWQDVI